MVEIPRKADGRREDVVPASQLREAYARIRELERALGRETMENEILRAESRAVRSLMGRSPASPVHAARRSHCRRRRLRTHQ